MVAVLGLVALGLQTYRSWTAWQAPIGVVGWRTVVDGSPAMGPDDGSPLVVHAHDEGAIALELQLYSPDPVEISRVDVSIPPRAPVRLVDVQTSMGAIAEGAEEHTWAPFHTFDPHSEAAQAEGKEVRIRLATATTACGDYGPGTSVVVDSIDVTYEARQRTRHLSIALPMPVEVAVPDGACV